MDELTLSKIHDLYKDKKYEDALNIIIEEEKKYPDNFELLKKKVMFLDFLDRKKEALEVIESAIKINQEDAEIYHIKGVLLYHTQRMSEAVEAFDKCLILQPNHKIAQQMKIDALILSGKVKEARNLYEESDFPEVLESYWLNNLGYMYVELNEPLRASPFLYLAKALYPTQPLIYYNLSRVWWKLKNPFKFLKHGVVFCVLSALDKLGFLKKYKERYLDNRSHISESNYYTQSGRLFSSSPHKRETKAILKLLNGMNASALCNDTWNWFAVNIPYDALSKSEFKGDIDIILKRPRYICGHDSGFTYRGFQVKTVLLDKEGNIKSWKTGEKKYKEIKKQLGWLKKFGCEQVFLLELFIIERGFSTYRNFPTEPILRGIWEKAQYLEELGFGYVVFAEEPLTTHDDESGGVMHMPINILEAKTNPIGERFQKLVNGIDDFNSSEEANEILKDCSRQQIHRSKPFYCLKCRKLTLIIPRTFTSYVCGRCKTIIC